MKNLKTKFAVLILSTLGLIAAAYGQITPSADSYTNTVDPTTNFGAKTLLDVDGATQATYIQFNLSSIPTSYTSADITKATLKLYVYSVAFAGSFNVDYVNGTWTESTITSSLHRRWEPRSPPASRSSPRIRISSSSSTSPKRCRPGLAERRMTALRWSPTAP